MKRRFHSSPHPSERIHIEAGKLLSHETAEARLAARVVMLGDPTWVQKGKDYVAETKWEYLGSNEPGIPNNNYALVREMKMNAAGKLSVRATFSTFEPSDLPTGPVAKNSAVVQLTHRWDRKSGVDYLGQPIGTGQPQTPYDIAEWLVLNTEHGNLAQTFPRVQPSTVEPAPMPHGQQEQI
jgi:ABC-type uncharacterized transport system YnjBCD substrate-binding protein